MNNNIYNFNVKMFTFINSFCGTGIYVDSNSILNTSYKTNGSHLNERGINKLFHYVANIVMRKKLHLYGVSNLIHIVCNDNSFTEISANDDSSVNTRDLSDMPSIAYHENFLPGLMLNLDT